jgi:hypothetical protein
METLETKKMPKNADKIYECNKCDFQCSKLSNYNKHLMTRKHQMEISGNKKMPKNAKNIHKCKICNKEFKTNSGLWKHSQKCNYEELEEENTKIVESPPSEQSLIIEVLKQNNEFKELILEQNKQIKELSTSAQTINNNNTVNNVNSNNSFNLNVFLNEDCKDALNIMDFVNSVKVKMKEVEDVGALGYAEGIGGIFVRALNELDVYQRPIHCSDLKRETLYVKDENGWEKEEETNPKVKKSIRYLAHQNVKAISEWKEKNSSWQKRHSQTEEQYYKITGNSMGACEPEGNEKNYNKIIRKVAKEVTIDKHNL